MTTTTAAAATTTSSTVDSGTSASLTAAPAADGSTAAPAHHATGQESSGATAGPTGSRTYPTGRPLDPKIRHAARGWQVTLPVARGAKKTRQATFATQAQAVAWKTAGVAALHAGQPLPDPANVDVPGDDQQTASASRKVYGNQAEGGLPPRRRPRRAAMTPRRTHRQPR